MNGKQRLPCYADKSSGRILSLLVACFLALVCFLMYISFTNRVTSHTLGKFILS